MTDIRFGLALPFLYGYRTFTGGSFANDYQSHLQQKANLRADAQNFMQKIMPVNQQSKAYQTTSFFTESVLEGISLAWGAAGLWKAGGFLAIKTLNTFEKGVVATKNIFAETKFNMNKLDVLSKNKTYSGIDVERIVKDVIKYNKSNSNVLKKTKPPFSGKELGIDSSKCPGKGFEWRGRGSSKSGKGNWYNSTTKEKLYSDFNHPPPKKPHWDYYGPNFPKGARLNLDGTWEPK